MKRNLQKSFTLIELMASVGVLVVAILGAMGIYLNIIGTRQKTLGQLNIQGDGQYLMSLMVKDVRRARVDYSKYVAGIDEPEDELYLLDSDDQQIVYRSESVSGRSFLKRCYDSVFNCNDDANYKSITMANVSIEQLDFYITPTSNPFSAGSVEYIHPRVTILLKLKAITEPEKIGEKQLILQQTVPQRYQERK